MARVETSERVGGLDYETTRWSWPRAVRVSRTAQQEADRRAGEVLVVLLDQAGIAEVDDLLAGAVQVRGFTRIGVVLRRPLRSSIGQTHDPLACPLPHEHNRDFPGSVTTLPGKSRVSNPAIEDRQAWTLMQSLARISHFIPFGDHVREQ